MDRESFRKMLAISGIGSRRADALFEAGFTSPESIRDASIEELSSVRGIGPTLAKRLKEAVNGPESEEEGPSLYLCPECGEAALVNEEGCKKCYACGYSEC